MPVFFLHDIRVDGVVRPQGHDRVVTRLGPSDDLGQVVPALARTVRANPGFLGDRASGWGSELVILCHGFPSGLQLGAGPGVTQARLPVFADLRNLFGLVTIRACSAAVSYNRRSPPEGPYDGGAFCGGLALTLFARVMASDTTQPFGSSEFMWNTTGDVVLPPWAGRVATWERNGHLLNITTPDQRRGTE